MEGKLEDKAIDDFHKDVEIDMPVVHVVSIVPIDVQEGAEIEAETLEKDHREFLMEGQKDEGGRSQLRQIGIGDRGGKKADSEGEDDG